MPCWGTVLCRARGDAQYSTEVSTTPPLPFVADRRPSAPHVSIPHPGRLTGDAGGLPRHRTAVPKHLQGQGQDQGRGCQLYIEYMCQSKIKALTLLNGTWSWRSGWHVRLRLQQHTGYVAAADSRAYRFLSLEMSCTSPSPSTCFSTCNCFPATASLHCLCKVFCHA